MRCLKLSAKAAAGLLAACLIATCSIASAQTAMLGPVLAGKTQIPPSDLAIIEVGELRKDMPCSLSVIKPELGFDLWFHSGYEVSIPLKELSGIDLVTMAFRVVPDSPKEAPSYFVQKLEVPPIATGARGSARLDGFFNLGEGKYHMDWLLRDSHGRVCSAYWDTEAALAPRDQQVAPALHPGAVRASEQKQFEEEPPRPPIPAEPSLNVKVLVNFAPQNRKAATLQPLDTAALVSILRMISRDPRIGRFSIVAFNLQEQQILYRRKNSSRIDFPALGKALKSLNPGIIDFKKLSQKNGETEFLTNLIQQEAGGEDYPDALIFAGPKAMLKENVSEESLKGMGEVEYPVFYMNYSLRPQAVPWQDAIGRAVKFFKGYEFTISEPRDLWAAVGEAVSKAVQFKSERRTARAAAR